MSRRFLLTIFTLIVIAIGTGVAIFFAKGYRVSPKDRIVSGTGIISITSIPDQASVYLDGHLTTATNTNINSLPPKTYKVRIVKEGFIPWEKDIEVKEGMVTNIKATLFPSIPSVYPLTYSGVENISLSPDEQRLAYVVPGTDKKSGIWVWEMSERPIGFARGREPHQIVLPEAGLNFSEAGFRWSPDSKQLMVNLADRSLLLDVDRLNDLPQDITAILQPTLISWAQDEETKRNTQLLTIKDLQLRKIASSSAFLKLSPDETKILIADKKELKDKKSEQKENLVEYTNFKVYDMDTEIQKGPIREYSLEDALYYRWLPNSTHLLAIHKVVDKEEHTISVIEFDGHNQAVIYASTFNKNSVFVWPDGSRVVVVNTLSIPTASKPNLFGINLK